MTQLVYLAGPITGCTYDGCTSWREYARSKLPNGIIGISPMRSKAYLSSETLVADHYDQYVMSCPKGITNRDRFDVKRCDAILMNVLDAERVSIGTMIEAGWADAYGKPIVLVIEEWNIHQHSILREIAGFIVPTLDNGIAVVSAVLLHDDVYEQVSVG